MTSTFSPNKGLELMVTGEDDGTWGIKTDSNLSILDLSLGGRLNISVAGSSNVTLTAAQAQNLIHVLTGVLTGNIQYIFPNTGGVYVIDNDTTGAFNVTVAMAGGGATVVVPQGTVCTVVVNPDSTAGVDLVASNAAVGTVTSLTAGAGITLTPNPITSTGKIEATATGVTYLAAGNGIVLTPNPITGTGTISVAGTISTGAFVASSSLQCNGTTGLLYLTANGVRQYYIQASNNGALYFVDASASIVTAQIGNGNGQWTWSYPGTFSSNLTVNGNMACANQVSGNTVVTNAITNNGASTLVGTISCNAISCSTINTNGNHVDAGNMNVAANGIAYNRTNSGQYFEFNWPSGTQLNFYVNGVLRGFWGFNNPSDERLKENIGPPEGDALEELRRIKLVSFDWRKRDAEHDMEHWHQRYGFNGQQLRSVIDEAVNLVDCYTLEHGVNEGFFKDTHTLDPTPLLARCVGAIQQLSAKVETLEARIAALETKLALLA